MLVTCQMKMTKHFRCYEIRCSLSFRIWTNGSESLVGCLMSLGWWSWSVISLIKSLALLTGGDFGFHKSMECTEQNCAISFSIFLVWSRISTFYCWLESSNNQSNVRINFIFTAFVLLGYFSIYIFFSSIHHSFLSMSFPHVLL